MVKKKEEPKPIEEEVFLKPVNPDIEALNNLWKVVNPSASQQNQIYEFYKKYINGSQRSPTNSCCGGVGSIAWMWNALKEDFFKNQSKYQ
jgi:hypothetical protein